MEPLETSDLMARLAFHTEFFTDALWFLVLLSLVGLLRSLFRRHK